MHENINTQSSTQARERKRRDVISISLWCAVYTMLISFKHLVTKHRLLSHTMSAKLKGWTIPSVCLILGVTLHPLPTGHHVPCFPSAEAVLFARLRSCTLNVHSKRWNSRQFEQTREDRLRNTSMVFDNTVLSLERERESEIERHNKKRSHFEFERIAWRQSGRKQRTHHNSLFSLPMSLTFLAFVSHDA